MDHAKHSFPDSSFRGGGGGERNERVLSRFLETNVCIPREWSHHPFSAARRFMTHPATQSSSFRQFLCRSQGRFCGNIVCLLSANRSGGTRRSNVRRSRHGRIGVPLGFFFSSAERIVCLAIARGVVQRLFSSERKFTIYDFLLCSKSVLFYPTRISTCQRGIVPRTQLEYYAARWRAAISLGLIFEAH